MKQLLVEYLPFRVISQHLQEGLKKQHNLIVEGIIQRANTKNQNGRVYPKDTLVREVDKYVKGPVSEARSLGELDHPESSVINLKNASHMMRKLWWDGDDLWGRIEVIPTPSGNILKELFTNNITVGISSRGMGSVKQIDEATSEVQEDFDLIAFDVVSTPSTQGAFLRPKTINENKDYTLKVNKYENINKIITEILCNRMGFCSCEFEEFEKFEKNEKMHKL